MNALVSFFSQLNPFKYFVSTFFSLALLFSFSACEKPPTPTPKDPCENNDNKWDVKLITPESHFDGLDIPMFVSGQEVEIALRVAPVSWNECASLHALEIVFQQRYSDQGFGQFTLSEPILTIREEGLDAEEEFTFTRTITPPNPGHYFVTAILYDEKGEVLDYEHKALFHVQQIISIEDPVMIRIGSPYHGQVVQRNAPLNVQYAFEETTFTPLSVKVDLLDEDNNVIATIEEDEYLDGNNLFGPLNTSVPGQYAIRATTSFENPFGHKIINNAAIHKFEVE